MSETEHCPITGREKVEGSDGIKRVPCEHCESADESALERPVGTSLLLCADCYNRYVESESQQEGSDQ